MHLPALLLVATFSATAATAQTHTVHRPPPPCHPLTKAMLAAPVTLSEPCYTVNEFLNAEHPIVVNPGVTITFGEGTALALDSNSSLEAVGTPDKPITLRGRNHSPGFWHGLTISSNSSRNRLSYVTLEDAGVKGNDESAIVLASGASLSIDHTTIRRSAGSGIFLLDRATFTRFEANHFEDNDTPLTIKASDAAMIDPATTFSGNKNNVVVLQFGQGKVTEDSLWRNLAVPYRVFGGIEVSAHLTVEPGARLEFRENIPLDIIQNGALTAIGTPEKPITFTSTDATPGYWSGIFFQSASSRNILRNVDIRYGGSHGGATGGCVGVMVEGSATVQSSTFYSCPVAIFVNRGATLNADAATSNTFHDNGRAVVLDQ